ncbi:MAG: SMI1/KNR4 family protein [Alphaproteobacteria bacterium]|nr:SMI1/KNR4 family protein [Alphaproteobacteria bacterium]
MDDAQSHWAIRFPPDLKALYLEHRPLFPDGGAIDWVASEDAVIESRLAWPFEGFWLDVENNDIWWPEWGERPEDLENRYEAFRTAFDAAPKLIPLYSYRYIPSMPHEAGNPVFSVYQTDVIYYGTDIMDYLDRELGGWDSKPWPDEIVEIPFWTCAVERND